MKKNSCFLLISCFLLLSNTTITKPTQTANGDRILGNWISSEKDLIVNCFKVNGKYFGKLIWFKKYNDNEHGPKEGGIPEDKWINSIILKNLTYENEKWVNGEILDLNTGKTYSNEVKMEEENSIIVTGYILFPVFGKSLTFKRN